MARRPKRIPVQNLRRLQKNLRAAADENEKSAERLIADIQKRKARIDDDFYAIGVALKKLSAPALYEAVGYENFRALLEGRKLMKPTTAYKLIAVVDQYPRGQAKALGLEKAYALTRFVAATPAQDLASTLASQDPIIGRTPLSRISVRQLESATQRVRRATQRGGGDPEAKAARRAARELQRALRAAGARSAKVKAIRLEGEWHLRTDMKVEDGGYWG